LHNLRSVFESSHDNSSQSQASLSCSKNDHLIFQLAVMLHLKRLKTLLPYYFLLFWWVSLSGNGTFFLPFCQFIFCSRPSSALAQLALCGSLRIQCEVFPRRA
jgi:hypothetical protein